METELRGKDGTSVTVAVTSFPIIGANGKIVGAAQLFRDVTKARQREREYKNFLSMYIYDMKNYIITSRGFLGRLKSDLPCTVIALEKSWCTHYRVKGYPVHNADEFQFVTDITIRGKDALNAVGVLPAATPPSFAAGTG